MAQSFWRHLVVKRFRIERCQPKRHYRLDPTNALNQFTKLFGRAKPNANVAEGQRNWVAGGYSLLEILIVVAIIGLLVTLVAPQLFGRLDQSRVTAAQAQVRMLRSALDSFRLDVGHYPAADEGLAALIEAPKSGDLDSWRGPYLDALSVPKDPWGHDYVYAPSEVGAPPAIYSLGSDGKPGGSKTAADVGVLPGGVSAQN
jgi:general secretion pathway protein G